MAKKNTDKKHADKKHEQEKQATTVEQPKPVAVEKPKEPTVAKTVEKVRLPKRDKVPAKKPVLNINSTRAIVSRSTTISPKIIMKKKPSRNK